MNESDGYLSDEIVRKTKVVHTGLFSLKKEHESLLESLSTSSTATPELDERIKSVSESLDKLEIGIDESSALVELSDYFETVASEKSIIELENSRITEENDWLREELVVTQSKLKEAYEEIEELTKYKKAWLFSEEIRNLSESSSVRPITPSKIPVGSWRVDEEKAINSALGINGISKRSLSPAPSKLPVGNWRNKKSAYKTVMEAKQIKDNVESDARNKRSYFKLNTPTSKIPSR